MPIAFYIFIIALALTLGFLGVHFWELHRGSVRAFERFRDRSDRYILKIMKMSHRKGKVAVYEAKRRAPETARTVVRALRKDRLRMYWQQVAGYTAKGIHEGIVYILRFFGKLRKHSERLVEKNLRGKK